MVTLPPELWLEILSYLDTRAIESLYPLNSLFLDQALSSRYRTFVFSTIYTKDVRRWRRLRDPFISQRVKHIQLHIRQLGQIRESVRDAQPLHVFGWKNRAAYAFKYYWTHISNEKKAENLTPPFRNIWTEMKRTIPRLTYATHLEVDVSEGFVYKLCAPILEFIWDTLGSHITTLSIVGDMCNYILFAGLRLLPQLSTLSLKLQHIPIPSVNDTPQLLRTTIIPLIQTYHEQLHTLHLDIWALVDISSMFDSRQLGPFPRLKAFSLRTPFDRSLARDPDHLAGFLHIHQSTLRSVEFDLDVFAHLGRYYLDRNNGALVSWINKLSSNATPHTSDALSSLSSISMYPPRRAFASFIGILQRSATTCTSLSIPFLPLSYVELQDVLLEVPWSQLTSLKCTVRMLDRDIVHLLKTVRLERVNITFLRLDHSDDVKVGDKGPRWHRARHQDAHMTFCVQSASRHELLDEKATRLFQQWLGECG